MRSFFSAASVVILAGCSGSDPAGTGTDHADAAAGDPGDPAVAALVGPAPLRRLSDTELLNALHDLFPSQNPELPALPAERLVAGFANAAEVQQPSDVRISRYETIAGLYAQGLTSNTEAVRTLVGCADWSSPATATACATQFVVRMGSLLFRRPITGAESSRFLQRFFDWQAVADFEAAVQLTLSTMLQSPQFLYRAEPMPGAAPGTVVALEPYAMASRLSFFLWESVPDDALLQAAGHGELRTLEQITAQAERMLADPRARRVFWSFHRQWLGLDRILDEEHLIRTPEVDAQWSAISQNSALGESRRFVENVLAEGGSFQSLFSSPRAWVDAEMARIYGIAPPVDPDGWSAVALPPSERAGILTRAAFLAAYSHRGGTSPPIRGNAILLRLLCQLPLVPPPGADLSMPVPPPDSGPQTNRMLFETRTRPAACMTCHRILNGFGFGFENYTAAGSYHSIENGLPIDARGEIIGTDEDRAFDGAVDLSAALARNQAVRACATQQWIRYALGRAAVDAESPSVDALANRFAEGAGDIHALLLGIATMPSFRLLRAGDN